MSTTPWWQEKEAFSKAASGLTTGVDDAEVLPDAGVTGIPEVSGGGSDKTALLALTTGCENLQSHRRLAV